MTNPTHPVIAEAIDYILSKVNNQISYVELVNKVPLALHALLINETQAKFSAMVKQHPILSKAGMIEQQVGNVPCLLKDSLMPKGVDRQSQEIDKMTTELNSSIKPKKKVFFGTRSSFKNKSFMDLTHKTSNLSVSSKSRKKKNINENLISLGSKEEEDPQIVSLWKKKNFQILEKEKQKKEQQEKAKYFIEKKETFEKEYGNQSKEYTFDFQGAPCSFHQNEEKINHHFMKARLAQGERRLKENLKMKDTLVSQVKIKNKMTLRQDSMQGSVDFNLNIPVFDSNTGDSGSLFGIPTDMGKYRLKDYRKHYGGRYTRLEKSLHTIDAYPDKPDEFSQIFSERRHFKDEESVNQSMISYRSRENSPTRRKLALPKIKGKYSTLDRYEQN